MPFNHEKYFVHMAKTKGWSFNAAIRTALMPEDARKDFFALAKRYNTAGPIAVGPDHQFAVVPKEFVEKVYDETLFAGFSPCYEDSRDGDKVYIGEHVYIPWEDLSGGFYV